MKQQLPLQSQYMVRAGLRGVTGTLMGERGKEPWDGDPALDGPSGQVRGVESQQTLLSLKHDSGALLLNFVGTLHGVNPALQTAFEIRYVVKTRWC